MSGVSTPSADVEWQPLRILDSDSCILTSPHHSRPHCPAQGTKILIMLLVIKVGVYIEWNRITLRCLNQLRCLTNRIGSSALCLTKLVKYRDYIRALGLILLILAFLVGRKVFAHLLRKGDE